LGRVPIVRTFHFDVFLKTVKTISVGRLGAQRNY